MAKIDYALKAKVLSEHEDILKLQRKLSLMNFLDTYTDEVIDDNCKEAVYDAVSVFFEDDEKLKLWREAERINLAYYARVRRLKDYIASMLLDGTCYFLTLTFTDSVLAKTSAQTRRKYVTLFLKTLSDTYCANIDFGSENGREHYHAVVMADSVVMSRWDSYGFSNAKKIRSEADYTPIAKYVSKLANHAVKATTRGSKAIYSRKVT